MKIHEMCLNIVCNYTQIMDMIMELGLSPSMKDIPLGVVIQGDMHGCVIVVCCLCIGIQDLCVITDFTNTSYN